MSRRASWPEVWLGVAASVATRSSCLRDQVGAVLVVDNQEVFVGYNGPRSGETNCEDGGCPRGQMSTDQLPHGARFDGVGRCTAVHAEINAINKFFKRGNPITRACVLYTTREPCHKCWEVLLNAGLRRSQIVWEG